MWRLYVMICVVVAGLSAAAIAIGLNVLNDLETSAFKRGQERCVSDVNSATIQRQAQQIESLKNQVRQEQTHKEDLEDDLNELEESENKANAYIASLTAKLTRIDNSIVDDLNAPVRGYKGERK